MDPSRQYIMADPTVFVSVRLYKRDWTDCKTDLGVAANSNIAGRFAASQHPARAAFPKVLPSCRKDGYFHQLLRTCSLQLRPDPHEPITNLNYFCGSWGRSVACGGLIARLFYSCLNATIGSIRAARL